METLAGKRLMTFLLTYFSMLARRAALEGWSLLKPYIQHSTALSTSWLGVFDTSYMLSSALGLLINGRLCDKYSIRKMISFGLLSSSGGLFLLSLAGYLGYHLGTVFAVLWLIEGYAQSAVYPACTKLMGKLYPSEHLGKVMGIWTSNASVGNIIGALLTTFLVGGGCLDWKGLLFLLGTIMLVASVLVVMLPTERNKTLVDGLIPKEGASFIDILHYEGLLRFGFCYSCVKMTGYAVMMWLPLYMNSRGLSALDIGGVMILYEVAGIVGSLGIGWVTDQLDSRVAPLLVLLVVSPPCMLGITIMESATGFYCCAVVMGACLNATANIISGVVSIELGKNNVGTVTGIIEGFANCLTGFGMFGMGVLQGYSWNLAWGLAIIVNLVGIAPLAHLYKQAK